jgi:hypothetical protein
MAAANVYAISIADVIPNVVLPPKYTKYIENVNTSKDVFIAKAKSVRTYNKGGKQYKKRWQNHIVRIFGRKSLQQ